MKAHNQKYTDDDVARIAALWVKDVITTEIAAKLRIPHGSVCRLARNARLRGDKRFLARIVVAKTRPKARPKPKAETPKVPKVAFISVNPTIYELRPNECKYAVTFDANNRHRFCAKPQKPGSPYCAEHDALCTGMTRKAGALLAFAGRPR